MIKSLHNLIMDRIFDLSSEILKLHKELEQWREVPFTVGERIEISLKIERKLQEQRDWAIAVSENEDEGD